MSSRGLSRRGAEGARDRKKALADGMTKADGLLRATNDPRTISETRRLAGLVPVGLKQRFADRLRPDLVRIALSVRMRGESGE